MENEEKKIENPEEGKAPVQQDFPKTEAPLEQPEAIDGEEEKQKALE